MQNQMQSNEQRVTKLRSHELLQLCGLTPCTVAFKEARLNEHFEVIMLNCDGASTRCDAGQDVRSVADDHIGVIPEGGVQDR